MKRLMSAVLAATLLAGSAASAQPFHPGPFGPPRFDRHERFERHEFVRFTPRHVWVRGERFYAPSYRYFVVNDWYRWQLRRPPFGYHWVRYGDEFLLVALSTGLVVDVMYSPF